MFKKLFKNNSIKLFIVLTMVVGLLAACGTAQQKGEMSTEEMMRVYASSVEQLSKETPIFIDEENKLVRVYATVNGKYLVEPTRHGMNWIEGAYGDQAVLKTYANPLAFNEALVKIGGTPAVDKGGDASKEFEETTEGKFIKGDVLNVSVTWESAEKDYDINEVMVDSTGKKIVYRFGGNYDAAANKVTGCYMCFDSCPVGITSNSTHPVGTFEKGNASFHGNPDVLPADGTPVVVTYSFME
ncbi:YdjY domain-containing protein [Calidifontibacillus oryziterrae]|uniref:YdjY domain-containing protein n=1 Tax=Calidifontibacillus oryziterrae TaxID=1191699 RepID=UPI0002D80279|nr:YdjY domain-containing protein [Calidifontibacillus oryziterrae]